MSSLTTINIDLLEPKFEQMPSRPGYTYSNEYAYASSEAHNQLGVKVATMTDWRGLEEKYFERFQHWNSRFEMYHGTLENISSAMRAKGHSENLWISDNSEDEGDRKQFLVYTRASKSTHWDYVDVMLQRGTCEPDYRGSLIVGDDARRILHLRSMENKSLNVMRRYMSALSIAIKVRLRQFIETIESRRTASGTWMGIDETIIIVKNKDRIYPIAVDRYGVMNLSFQNIVLTYGDE